MRKSLLSVPIVTLALCSSNCSDASGGLIGGESIYAVAASAPSDATSDGASDPALCPLPGTAPAGQTAMLDTVSPVDGGMPRWQDLYSCFFVTCGAAGLGCHNVPGDTGARTSGFVCGSDAKSCWNGMQSTSSGTFSPIVPNGGATNATTTGLLKALRYAGSQGLMPVVPATYSFSSQDIAAIQAWIQGGALYN